MVSMTIDGRPAITPTEAAHRLGASVMKIFRAAHSGAFSTTRLNALLIDEAEFNVWKKKEEAKKDKSSN